VSQYERLVDTKQFADSSDFPEMLRRDTKRDNSSNDRDSFLKNERRDSLLFNSVHGRMSEHRRSTSRPLASSFKETSGTLAMKSATTKQAMEKFLSNQNDETTVPIFGETTITLPDSAPVQHRTMTAKKESLKDSMKTWIDKKLTGHIAQMID